MNKGFSGRSAGKESAWKARDSNLIPGSGRSPAEWISYPLQYSWASLVAHMVKNLPVVQETWVGKIPWRREWHPTPVFLPEEFHEQRSLVGYSPWGLRESDTTE